MEKTIGLRKPWKRLPTRAPFVLHGLSADSDPLEPPWPELIVTCAARLPGRLSSVSTCLPSLSDCCAISLALRK